MTDDRDFRQLIHEAVDAYGSQAVERPLLAQRILAQAHRKEHPPMKKKLSLATILLLTLLLVSMAALAAGLSAHQVWQESLEKMNTSSAIRSDDDGTLAELPLEKAIAIARAAIIAKYGAPESELDAMGVYPTYFPRGWDGQTDEYPSEWDIRFSSRTDVDLDLDTLDYGPTGEYGVYINAETREVTFCNWYTNDFWARAQTIWDCGSHDEVYNKYKGADFRRLPQEEQDYWTALLAENGYEVIPETESLYRLLSTAATRLQFCDLAEIADNADPQVAAAWLALETQYGFDAALLQKFAFVATHPDWQTGTDNICIHFSYSKQESMVDSGYLDHLSNHLFSYATHFGLYMVSFEPGTTQVAEINHVTRSRNTNPEPTVIGRLLGRTDWTADDLSAFNEAFDILDRAVKRMRAAGLETAVIEAAVQHYLFGLGSGYPAEAPEDTEQYFAETSEWDAYIAAPAMTYDEFIALYGPDIRLWPMEVMISLQPQHFRMPHPGETTLEEATAKGLAAIVSEHGQAALDELNRLSPTGQYTVICLRVSLTGDPDVVDCRWEVFVTADPMNPVNGWRVTWGEWEDKTIIDTPYVQDITDRENG